MRIANWGRKESKSFGTFFEICFGSISVNKIASTAFGIEQQYSKHVWISMTAVSSLIGLASLSRIDEYSRGMSATERLQDSVRARTSEQSYLVRVREKEIGAEVKVESDEAWKQRLETVFFVWKI